MINLVIFDKDGTLTSPIGGQTFVSAPHDQQLRPGVAQKLAQLESAGISMAVASNQGGCSVFEALAEDIKEGMTIDLDGVWAKVQEVEGTARDTHLLTDIGRYTISGLYKGRYKSIEQARLEMAFALKLANIRLGFFCPDMDGRSLQVTDWNGNGDTVVFPDEDNFGAYRKPKPGMLLHIKDCFDVQDDRCLMVGDRPEDQAAAKAAGMAFEWANDYFGGAIDVPTS